MKKLFGLLAVLVFFLAGIFAALAIFPPTGLAHRLLVAGVRTATGLDLKIAGPMSLRLFPTVALRMEDVSLTAPVGGVAGSGAGGVAAPLASARVMEVHTTIAAALSGERRVERVAMTGARIDVVIGKDGIPEGAVLAQRRSPGRTEPVHISIGVLEMTDANIDYRQLSSGLTARFTRAGVTVREVRLDRFGEALVKAGAASVKDPSGAGNFEVSDLDAKLTDFQEGRVRQAQGTGSAFKWQDAAQKTALEASDFSATARSAAATGAEAVSFTSATAKWRDGAGPVLEGTGVTGSASGVSLEGAGASKVNAGNVTWREASGIVMEAQVFAGEAGSVRAGGLGAVAVKADAFSWRNAAGKLIEASRLDARAKSLNPARAEELEVKSAKAGFSDGKRSTGPGSGFALEEASFAAPVFTLNMPIEGVAGFVWNKEKVGGKVKLPPLDVFAQAVSIPTTLALTSGRGNLDFDGSFDTATGSAKGRTRAVTTAADDAARWLGIAVPATLKGALDVAGDVEITGPRMALSNGRIEHGGNTLTGSVSVDRSGQRPRLSGRVSADRLDMAPYLGLKPVASKPRPDSGAKPAASKPQIIEPEVQLSDVFKSTMRAMLQAPVTRDGKMQMPELTADELIPAGRRAKPSPGAFAWSEDKFDVTGLRDFDLDVDWSVKQLDVRGIAFSVPQLKTVLNAGTLSLEGRDVGTKDGKISGRAEIDARGAVPSVAATLKGEGVDLYALSAALDITPVIEGDTAVEANLKSRGTSPKQLVEGLSGTVKTNMAQGNVLGYDLGNITLATFIRWITGNREYDPERRTPISGLKADLTIEKGIVKDSQVVMGGPLLGVNAEGTIGLIDQRIDYRGKARIASWFSGLPFKIFGDLKQPTFQPDLGLASVFSRSPPGEATLTEIVQGADIKEDAELALLIGQVLKKAGPNGLDPATAAALNALQGKALGRP